VPISKVNPFAKKFCARPPGKRCFSSKVTSHPAFAIKEAADKPAKQLPMTITFCIKKLLRG